MLNYRLIITMPEGRQSVVKFQGRFEMEQYAAKMLSYGYGVSMERIENGQWTKI